LVGGEKVKISLITHDDRIGCGPVLTPCGEVWDGAIAIVQVDGVAIGFKLLTLSLRSK
jgi:hypothetical protein